MSARRCCSLVVIGALAACSSTAVGPPDDLPFAARMIARSESAPRASKAAGPATADTDLAASQFAPLPAFTRRDEWRGILEASDARVAELESAAADDTALTDLLRAPLAIGDLAVLAALRAPEARTARARYEAARTAYSQSQDLGDLIGLYRSFTTGTNTRVGPERSRRETGMVAPAPNVSGLSAEVARRTADMAFESLRAATRDVVAQAWRSHADAARLEEARKIVREEVELNAVLLDVLRSRLESGSGSQAGYLAFQSRLERLQTELAILDRRETVVRAEWNRLLARPESAPVLIAVATEQPGATPDRDAETALIELALGARQDLRAARLVAERAELGLRLAETMTLPRMDVGSARFERERAGEAGVARGAVFPEPGRMVMPRYDFGVREAQVQEMRSRLESMREARDALSDRVQTETRSALFEVESARLRLEVHERELVPLARDSLDAARGAYEGGGTGYLDLLDAVRRLLDARLGLADSHRNLVHSQAGLLRAVGVKPVDR